MPEAGREFPETKPASPETALVRAIGVRALAASIVNATVGAGIFVLPAVVAGAIGPAAPFAYAACAVTMSLIAACFAMAGSRVSRSGGVYAYVESAFGPYAGFIAGLLYWASALFGAATVATALASSVGVAFPVLASFGGRTLFIVGVFGAFAWLNVRGVEAGARTVELITVAKLLPLAVFVGAGVFFVQAENVRPALPDSPQSVGAAVLTLIFAFVGIEVSLVPSGEFKDPARTVPRAVGLALAVVTVLYMSIQFVASGLLGPALAGAQAAPLADASALFLGPVGSQLMVAGAAISMAGYLSGDVLSSPRLLFAFGRDGLLPPIFATIHPRFRTPAVAILVHSVIAAALAVIGRFGRLLLLANVSVLTMYFLCCAAAWQLARRDVRAGGQPFVVPGGTVVSMAACAAIVWILSSATLEELEVESALVAAGTVVFLMGQRRRIRRGSSGPRSKPGLEPAG